MSIFFVWAWDFVDVQAQVEGNREVKCTSLGLGQLGCFFVRLFSTIFFLHSYFFVGKERNYFRSDNFLTQMLVWRLNAEPKLLCLRYLMRPDAARGRGGTFTSQRLSVEHSKEMGWGKKRGKERKKVCCCWNRCFFCRRCYCKIVIFPVLWASLANFFSLLKTKGGKQSKLLCGHEFFLLMDVWGLYVVFLLTCMSIFPFNHTNIICSFSHN